MYWRIQHYCKIHGRENEQKINIKLRHNVLLMISFNNFVVPLYLPLNMSNEKLDLEFYFEKKIIDANIDKYIILKGNYFLVV